MRALDSTPDPTRTQRASQLAEVLMSAAAELTEVGGAAAPLAPSGVPVRCGRLHLGRVRHWLPTEGPVTVATGFATACWLGSPDEPCPELGRLVHRSETSIDRRGRLVLGRQARAWLAVAGPAAFEVVVMPCSGGGVLVVPVEDFGRRFEAVSP